MLTGGPHQAGPPHAIPVFPGCIDDKIFLDIGWTLNVGRVMTPTLALLTERGGQGVLGTGSAPPVGGPIQSRPIPHTPNPPQHNYFFLFLWGCVGVSMVFNILNF